MALTVAEVVARFGEEVQRKLGNLAISGAPEDQLRAPLEQLFPALAAAAGVVQQVTLVGETTLSAQAIRPDFAVTKGNALIGFIEVKAPGKGANPRRFTDAHDKAQWTRLQLLPNLIYTDGQSFSLWQEGQLVRAVDLDGDLYSAGRSLKAPSAILDLLRDFMGWQPIPPDTPRKLAETSARLCRLLRDEVLEEVRGGLAPLTSLAQEWRALLFPEADDAQFADGYAQAVTFGLLMARARGLPLDAGLSQVSQLLRQSNSTLIGAALRLLTDNDDIRKAMGSALGTLGALSLTGVGWAEAESDWRAPLLPPRAGDWASYPALTEFFGWSTPGVKTHRTWIIAPDEASLSRRWEALITARDPERKALMFHPDRDRTLGRTVKIRLGGHELRGAAVAEDGLPVVKPTRYGFRSFDRQWIIPDHRLISQARPELWAANGTTQVHLTALQDHQPGEGPAISLTANVPDNDHFRGSFGGRAFPLWLDPQASDPNLKPALLAHLSTSLGRPVTAPGLLAYIAALLAHPGFERRFRDDLLRPGLRVPLTADPALFAEAATLGARVVWLHCYGERFADPAQGRPYGPPRLPPGIAPQIPLGGTIAGAPEPLPDELVYDAATRTLHVGKGRVENVPPEVVAYQVSGRPVLRQWFSYRRRDRTRPVIGERKPPSPLEAIQPDGWIPEYTEDLLNLIHVLALLVELEPAQDDLLARVCAGPLIDARSLEAAGALASPPKATSARRKNEAQGDLFNGP